MMGVGAQFEITRELIEAQVAFFLIGSVAASAVLLDERVVGFRGRQNTNEAEDEYQRCEYPRELTEVRHFTG